MMAETNRFVENRHIVDYLLSLADSSLILSQQNSRWCGHGPMLEQDIAITNISLDQLGQARYIYQYAAELLNNMQGSGLPVYTEDTLAYLRDVKDYKNCLLVELPPGDWAHTVLQLFFFSAYQFLLYGELQSTRLKQLAGIAEKSLKEVKYHLKWSSEWVIRLGDGTEKSNKRLNNAVTELWPYTEELFSKTGYETVLIRDNVILDVSGKKQNWLEIVKSVFRDATVEMPADTYQQKGGKEGLHTENLGYILAEMQFLQRAYPGMTW